MKITSEIDKINKMLQNSGEYAKIWLFDTSHVKMAIKIYSKQSEELFYLVAAGCKHIKGSFYLHNPKFSIIQYFDDESLETVFKIIDDNSDFELKATAGVALAKGVDSEFGDSFEDFLKEK